jgi:hypothetical protein
MTEPWDEPPEGADLLEVAREVLVGDVIPHLAAEQRYPALMIANAIAIARRAVATAPPTELAERLRTLVGGEDLAALRQLAARIAAGAYDPGCPRRAEAAAFLRALSRHRAGISNPKALG